MNREQLTEANQIKKELEELYTFLGNTYRPADIVARKQTRKQRRTKRITFNPSAWMNYKGKDVEFSRPLSEKIQETIRKYVEELEKRLEDL